MNVYVFKGIFWEINANWCFQKHFHSELLVSHELKPCFTLKSGNTGVSAAKPNIDLLQFEMFVTWPFYMKRSSKKQKFGHSSVVLIQGLHAVRIKNVLFWSKIISKLKKKNPAYGRHWICRPMRIKGPIIFFFFLFS